MARTATRMTANERFAMERIADALANAALTKDGPFCERCLASMDGPTAMRHNAMGHEVAWPEGYDLVASSLVAEFDRRLYPSDDELLD